MAEKVVYQAIIASSCLLWTQRPVGLGKHLISEKTAEETVPLSESAEKGWFSYSFLVLCFLKNIFLFIKVMYMFNINSLIMQESVRKT